MSAKASRIEQARLTVVELSRVHHPRRHAEEQDALLGVLAVEQRIHHVGCRLADDIRPAEVELVLGDELDDGLAGAEGDNLLGPALADQRDGEVEEVDVADDVDVEGFG